MSLSRQELYDKIKETSKDEYQLKEMKRLGFWTDDQPTISEELIKRKGVIQKEINQLSKEIRDPAAALRAIHKQRMEDARQRRVDTQIKRELQRYQRATNWYKKQQTKLNYLGNTCYIKTDEQAESDITQLTKQQLPICHNALELAELMGITLNELRFLCYTDKVSKRSHYQQFAIKKKTGGNRLISAPMPRLKRVQYWILDQILMKQSVTEQAHGFVTGKSIVTNAEPHIGQALVINMDLKNFFPTISYPRIKGLFMVQGFNDEVASILATLCSEPETQMVEMDQQRYFIHGNQRFLPQGAPTSPMISNLLCYRLDKRLQGLANKHDFKYTRYADDLTFSSSKYQAIKPLLNWVKSTVKEEGFTLHPDKTRVMHKGRRQEVTGIVVNQHLSLNRKVLKQFRALLFQLKKDGVTDNQHWGKGGELIATITGFAHYVRMVKPELGTKFLNQITEIKNIHGNALKQSHWAYSSNKFREKSAEGKKPLASMSMAEMAAPPKITDIIHHQNVLKLIEKKLNADPKMDDAKLFEKEKLSTEALTSLATIQEIFKAVSISSPADSVTESHQKNSFLDIMKGFLGK